MQRHWFLLLQHECSSSVKSCAAHGQVIAKKLPGAPITLLLNTKARILLGCAHQGNWVNPRNPYSTEGMHHGSREVLVAPLTPALCSSLQEFPAYEQKCLKPRTDLQSKMIHYSSLAIQRWPRLWSSILMSCWRVLQDWSWVLGASLQLNSQWAQLSAREQKGCWVGEARTVPAEAVCSPWEAVLTEIEIYKTLPSNYLSVH